MPEAHRKHQEWTPRRFITWATPIGLATVRLVTHLLELKPHPEQGYRSCLGLLNLSKRFGDARLEKACERAWQLGAKTRSSVDAMLRHNLEDMSILQEQTTTPTIYHENLRGKKHYH